MNEIALAVAGPDGGYREIEGGGYARAALVDRIARFEAATANWGVVRAILHVQDGIPGDWRPLAASLLVRAGARMVYDDNAGVIVVYPQPETPLATGPTLTARPYNPTVRG